MNKLPNLPHPGRCIYCNSDEIPLSDEHIIPQSLGGRRVLAKASCPNCRDITSDFERIVSRDMYWPLRLRLGLWGNRKHKKKQPTHWPGVITDEHASENLKIEVGKLPRLYAVIEFPPAGILTDQPLSDNNPPLTITIKGDRDEMARIAKELGVQTLEFSHTLKWADFARMLAKIAHAYSVKIIGLEGVEYFLPPLIRGEENYLSHFVGGIENTNNSLIPPNDLAIGIKEIRGSPHIYVRTTIFGGNRFPTYEIIVGRVTDIELVSKKLSAQ